MLKQKILNLMVKTDAFAPFRFLNRSKIPILMYHRFSPDNDFNATSAQTLTNHLEYLTKKYQIIPLSELAAKFKNNEPIAPNSAVITIDDGYDDAYSIAFPIFKKFNVPATLFVVTDFLDGKIWIWTDKARYLLYNTKLSEFYFEIGAKKIEIKLSDKNSRLNFATKINSELKKLSTRERDEKINELAKIVQVELPELPPKEFAPISWEQAREMDENGVNIESHTVTHPILTNINETDLGFELTESRRTLCEKLNREVKIFCYPNGNVSTRESEAVAKSNYDCAVTTEIRLSNSTDNLFLLPRIDAEPEMTRFIQSTSGFDSLKK
ncbi:MAG: polysaccharide deacetylase family protein [Pyrinomonadaceae bacterium]|nr:polysaccharide deacetylase family protein [Pyrinomonadaceae bacterium]